MFAVFNKTVTGTRASGSGDYNTPDGSYNPPTRVTISIQSSVQPSPDKELKLLPEGRRTDGAYSLRSATEILEGDIFNIYGNDHEVLRVRPWQNGIIPHYLGIAVRMHNDTE